MYIRKWCCYWERWKPSYEQYLCFFFSKVSCPIYYCTILFSGVRPDQNKPYWYLFVCVPRQIKNKYDLSFWGRIGADKQTGFLRGVQNRMYSCESSDQISIYPPGHRWRLNLTLLTYICVTCAYHTKYLLGNYIVGGLANFYISIQCLAPPNDTFF